MPKAESDKILAAVKKLAAVVLDKKSAIAILHADNTSTVITDKVVNDTFSGLRFLFESPAATATAKVYGKVDILLPAIVKLYGLKDDDILIMSFESTSKIPESAGYRLVGELKKVTAAAVKIAEYQDVKFTFGATLDYQKKETDGKKGKGKGKTLESRLAALLASNPPAKTSTRKPPAKKEQTNNPPDGVGKPA